jgi:hypothetical protein
MFILKGDYCIRLLIECENVLFINTILFWNLFLAIIGIKIFSFGKLYVFILFQSEEMFLDMFEDEYREMKVGIFFK